MLVLSRPLTFALFSWLWFALWKHYALRVCLSVIYETLADYIQYRQDCLLERKRSIKDASNTSLSSCSNRHFNQSFRSETRRR
ncbi:hypothetical protein O9992_17315 [Vibrio lentus]|nr:hypothetical protein [Vibrio lentus]